MKPLGRKYYLDKTGGKHKTKINGKTCAWWIDSIPPDNCAHKTSEKKEIKEEVERAGY